MHTAFTLWMNFLHVQMYITDLYDCVNVYLTVLHPYMCVCFRHVPLPIVLWQSQGSIECMYVCMYVYMYVCMHVCMLIPNDSSSYC
jgi:hypothetical protein